MRVLVYPVNLETHRESFSLYLGGDLHYGDPNCDVDCWMRLLDAVQEDPARVKMLGLMGDYIYSFPKQDRRNWGMKKPQKADVLGLYTDIREMLRPVSNRVIACLAGNHDEDWMQAEGIDFVNWMCAELNIPYAGYECYVRFKVSVKGTNSKRNVDLVLWHGAGGGRTLGGAFNKARYPIDSFRRANVVAMGHMHRLGMAHEQWTDIVEKTRDVVAEDQYFVLTGGYQKGYSPKESTYISRKMLPPVAIGGVKLTIQPFRHGSGGGDALDVQFSEVR